MIDLAKKLPLKDQARLIFDNHAKRDAFKQAISKTSSQAKPLTELQILPVIPIREGVLFPSTESVLTFGRKASMAAVKKATQDKNLVVLLTQKNEQTEEPKTADLYQVGTLAIVERTLKTEGQINALVRGIGRVQIAKFMTEAPLITAQIKNLTDYYPPEKEHTSELQQ